MRFTADLITATFIMCGGFFLFVGSFGLAKLPDTMRRLHGPTKATTLGIGSLLMASMMYFLTAQSGPSIHEILITLFLFLTAPVSANMIAKAYLLRSRLEAREQADAGAESDGCSR